MGTTITSQTMQVSIKETITLAGIARNGESNFSISGIGQINTGILSIPQNTSSGGDGRAIVADFGADAEAKATQIVDDVKYIRITNLDDTVTINLRIADTGSDEFVIRLKPTQSFIMCDTKLEADNGAINVYTAITNNITQISASAIGGAADLEYYIGTS
tara:strand:+ start:342 stop:821 length:480 start_codon:yes stop_codon:yes gene_type:complete